METAIRKQVIPKLEAYQGIKPLAFELEENKDQDGDTVVRVVLYYEDTIANSKVPYDDLIAVETFFYEAIDQYRPQVYIYFFLDSILELQEPAS